MMETTTKNILVNKSILQCFDNCRICAFIPVPSSINFPVPKMIINSGRPVYISPKYLDISTYEIPNNLNKEWEKHDFGFHVSPAITTYGIDLKKDLMLTGTYRGGVNAYSTSAPTVIGVQNKSSIHNAVHMYPNPASDQIFFEFSNAIQSGTAIHIYDETGKEQLNYVLNQPSTFIPLNIQKLTPGVYYVTISNSEVNTLPASLKLIRF